MSEFTYPTPYNYTCNSTSQCYNEGICVYNNYINENTCLCKVYYDPITMCKKTLYEEISSKVLSSYIIIGISLCIIYIILFCLELSTDIAFLGKKTIKTLSFGLKTACIISCIIKIISLSIFTNGMINNNPDLASIENTLKTISTTIFYISYNICLISWFELILKLKTLGLESHTIKIFRLSNIIILSIFAPLYAISNILYQYNIIPFVSNIINNIAACAMILLPMTINLIYAIKVFIIINNLINTEHNSNKINKLKQKTIILTTSNIILLIFISWGIYGSLRPRELIIITMLRAYIPLVLELLITFLFWLFIQNYAFRESYKPFSIYCMMCREDKDVIFANITSGKSTNNTSSDKTDTKQTTKEAN